MNSSALCERQLEFYGALEDMRARAAFLKKDNPDRERLIALASRFEQAEQFLTSDPDKLPTYLAMLKRANRVLDIAYKKDVASLTLARELYQALRQLRVKYG